MNPVHGDFFGQGIGTPFIYDKGTSTVHVGPTGSVHGELARALIGKMTGPIYNGEHNGSVIEWHDNPALGDREQVAQKLSDYYGSPLTNNVDHDEEFGL